MRMRIFQENEALSVALKRRLLTIRLDVEDIFPCATINVIGSLTHDRTIATKFLNLKMRKGGLGGPFLIFKFRNVGAIVLWFDVHACLFICIIIIIFLAKI